MGKTQIRDNAVGTSAAPLVENAADVATTLPPTEYGYPAPLGQAPPLTEYDLAVPAPQDQDVRESMPRFPEPIEAFVTWLTGKPRRGQRQLWRRIPLFHVMTASVELAFGVAMSAVLVSGLPIYWPLLILTWMLTVGGARKLQVTICHHCVHTNVTGREGLDRWLGQALSVILKVQDYTSYWADHVVVHHSKLLARVGDPDLEFLRVLGFVPGKSRLFLWLRLLLTTVSPTFHMLFLVARIRADLITCSPYRRLAGVVFTIVVLLLVWVTDSWVAFLVAWVLPLTVFYQISALLQFTSEHRWHLIQDPEQTARVVYSRKTYGRFMGSSLRKTGKPLRDTVELGLWVVKMLFLHLPARLFVMVGDLPCHDYHHRHPKRAWANVFYDRQADLDAGCPGWPEVYSEVWGLIPAIDEVYVLLSNMPPLEVATKGLSLSETADSLNEM